MTVWSRTSGSWVTRETGLSERESLEEVGVQIGQELDRVIEERHRTPMHPVYKFCDCGVLVWDVMSSARLPKFSETIICWHCQKDHSRRPLALYQLWWLRRELGKAKRRFRRWKRAVFAFPFLCIA